MKPELWKKPPERLMPLLEKLKRAKLLDEADRLIYCAFDWQGAGLLPDDPQADVCERTLLELGLVKEKVGFDELYRALKWCQSAWPDTVWPTDWYEHIAGLVNLEAAVVAKRIAAAVDQCRERIRGLLALPVSGQSDGERLIEALGPLVTPWNIRKVLLSRQYPKFLLNDVGIFPPHNGKKYLEEGISFLVENPGSMVDFDRFSFSTFLGEQRKNKTSCIRRAIRSGWERMPYRIENVMRHPCLVPPEPLAFIKGAAQYIIEQCEDGELYDLIGYDPETGTCRKERWSVPE